MIDIHKKNLNLSEEQEEYVQAKMEKLLHYSKKLGDDSVKIKVEIDYDPVREKHNRILCMVTIFAPNGTMRSETHSTTVNSAIDECEAKLHAQIEKFKAK